MMKFQTQSIDLGSVAFRTTPSQLYAQQYSAMNVYSYPYNNNEMIDEGNNNLNTFALTQLQNCNNVKEQSNVKYNKSLMNTMKYLKDSHNEGEIKSATQVLPQISNQQLVEKEIQGAVESYNRFKKRMQLEARQLYEQEAKTLKKEEENLKRVESVKLNQQKMKKQKQEQIKQTREELKFKMEKIRDKDREFNQRQKQLREEQQKRLEIEKRKLQEEAQQRQSQLELKKAHHMRMRMVFAQRQSQIQEEEWVKQEMQMDALNAKMAQTDSNLQVLTHEIKQRLQQQQSLEVENIQRAQKLKEEQQVQKETKMIESLFQISAVQEQIKKTRQKNEKQHKKELLEKQKAFKVMIQNLKRNDRQKVSNYYEREAKVKENFKRKVEREEEARKELQELQRLKDKDKIDNYERNKRANQYKLEKLIWHDKQVQNKLSQLKSGQNFIRQTKLQVHKEEKFEEERILNGIQKVNDLVFMQKMANTSKQSPLTKKEKKQGLKILSSILDLSQQKIDLDIFIDQKVAEEDKDKPIFK